MVFQDILGGSSDVDVVYGPDDVINPVVFNIGDSCVVNLKILIKNLKGDPVWEKTYQGIELKSGRTIKKLESIKPVFPEKGYYVVEYIVY
jgi:hypothetical protein